MGLDVASVVLGSQPPKDARPWVVGAEAELKRHDDEVAQASTKKREAFES